LWARQGAHPIAVDLKGVSLGKAPALPQILYYPGKTFKG